MPYYLTSMFMIHLYLSVSIPLAVTELGSVEAFKRGFFCNDESLKHPYKEETVSTANLMIGTVLGPIVLVSIFLNLVHKKC